ncbi:transporter [Shigella sonnei]|nr:transporter [Escherichia coli]EFX1748282.1 transporter [Shigella sonnei]
MFCCVLLSFHACHLSVTDDVVVPATATATATATVLLFPVALITVCFVVLLTVLFPGVPLAGRAVVNGASGAVSALAGFHP